MEEVDSRFLHLLQPIRDLTKNWEVDVAAQLGEYLEELDHICISFDNGKTTMNFMEAALLIQGSACIYSKKVSGDWGWIGIGVPAPSPGPLSCPKSPGPPHNSPLCHPPVPSQAVNIVPLTPMSLVPPEEGEKKENPLLSRRGEVLASRRDFRMNTSTPHASGAFLLELAGLSPTHPLQEQPLGTPTGREWGLLAAPPAPAHSRPAGAAGDDDDDVLGALGDDMEVTPVPNEHIEAQRVCVGSEGLGGLPVLLPWNPRAPHSFPGSPNPFPRAPQCLIPSPEPPTPSLDPWMSPVSPAGRPFLVPQGLEDTVGGKRKRRGPRKLQDFIRWFSAVCDLCFGGHRGPPKPPSHPADLEVLYWRQFKERMAAHRKLQSRGVSGLGTTLGGLGGLQQPLPRLWGCSGGAQGCSSPQEPLWEPELEREAGGLSPFPSLCPQELFMASSQKFAQETELSQRIRLWEERMEPLLQEQEHRAPFSVRAYGQALTQRCSEPGRWHSLASLVAGQPPFEVCRYLLASLQLVRLWGGFGGALGGLWVCQDPGLLGKINQGNLINMTA
uniref:Condensin-2 complex subunit H2 n=1 Tax=Zosterops lateralis melanops TaxID=1220523 RepID=A0A8D2PT08_ZOSLA